MNEAAGALPGIALVSHCLANQNAKVDEYAVFAGVSPVIGLLRRRGFILQQMPCPEMSLLGTKRWWHVREQYDTPGYRRHCRALANSVADVLEARLAEGPRDVVLLGVDGSPSSGVTLTGIGTDPNLPWGGRPEDVPSAIVPGKGVWIEELEAVIAERGLPAPRLLGIPMELPGYSVEQSLRELDAFLAAGGSVGEAVG
jgi:predicted secreted protein